MNCTRAKLLYTTSPQAGCLLLNLQTEADIFWQIEMTREQLAGLIVDGVRFLLWNTADALPRPPRPEPAPRTPPATDDGAGSSVSRGGSHGK